MDSLLIGKGKVRERMRIKRRLRKNKAMTDIN